MPIYKTKDKNKDGVFKYKVRINYTDSYGNYKQLTRTAWGMSAAKDLERDLNNQIKNKDFIVQNTVDVVFNEYISTVSKEIRQSSLSKKKTAYNMHIAPVLANTKLKDLNVRTLTQWKDYVNSKSLSITTKKNVFSELRAFLNYAVKMEYLPANPLFKVDNFKDAYFQEKDIDFYTPQEFLKYIAIAKEKAVNTNNYDYYIFFIIRYYTGARKGEIHALRWNCLKGNKLSIKRSITQKLGGGDVETPPKNKSSIRTIQIPQILIDVLKEHKARQKSAIPDWNDNGYICAYYQPLRDTSIDNENREYAEKAGLKRIRIHDFRHSHASLLINSQINALEVAHRLGHSTVDQTLKTYAHLFPDETEKAIAVLDMVK